jgi:hypothetical protein
MSSLLGKTYIFSFSFGGGANGNLRTLAVNAGWDGVAIVNATNSGTWNANDTSSYAFSINGSFPRGVSFTNNGSIYGYGGQGGAGAPATQAGPAVGGPPDLSGGAGGGVGIAGGPALLVQSAVTIYNNGSIVGGGGGGGGSGNAKAYGTSVGTPGQPAYSLGPTTVVVSCSGGAGAGGAGFGPANGVPGPHVNYFSGINGSYSSIDINVVGTNSTAGSQTGAGTTGSGGTARVQNTIGYGTVVYLTSGSGGTGGPGGGGAGYGPSGGYVNGTNIGGPGGAGGAAGVSVNGDANITWATFGSVSGPRI